MRTSGARGVVAAVLLALGLVLMVGPPLARDGICGLFGCADEVPDIAVTRSGPDAWAVLVPPGAAADVSVVRLLEGSRSAGSQRWAVRRTAAGTTASARRSTPDAFPVGDQPDGFRTVTELQGSLTAEDASPRWVAEVAFRCSTASLPFTPSTLEVGQVRSWTGATDGAAFADSARAAERCASSRGGAESVLFWLGAAAAVAGAVLGIWVVMSRPPGGDEGDDAWPASG